jgi:hypothetical protein
MRNPFKKGEILDDGGQGGCIKQAFSIVVLIVVVLGAFGGAAWYGVTGFLERI